MIRRLSDLIRGLASLAAIAALILGIPAVLWQLGGPPGARIVDTLGDQLSSDSTRTEAILAGALLIIAWVCWAQLAYAIAIEAIAAARGRTPRRATILPGFQALAARLVASLTLTFSALLPTVNTAAAIAPLRPIVDSPTQVTWNLDASAARPMVGGVRSTATAVAAKTYITDARDTFWSIAEATLGDGLRWTEIRDANLGRRMPDGTAIAAVTETVHGGWELHLPADAVLPFSDEADIGAAEEVEVESGDHFWAIAEAAMTDAWGRDPSDAEVAPYWADVIDLNDGRLLPPNDPDLIYPGQVFKLPAVPVDPLAPEKLVVAQPAPEIGELEAPEPVFPEPEQPASTVAETPSVATVEPSRPPASTSVGASIADDAASSAPFIALGIGSLGVSAGALALTLRRRRAHQAAKRKPGTRVAEPPLESIDYEAAVRPIADTEAARWIEAANKFLTHRLAQAEGAALPAVIAVRAGQFGVEFLLDEPCTPPAGFIRTADGPSTWRLDSALSLADVEADAAGAQPYSPALLPAGRTTAGDLLIDFEQLGALSLAGPPERIAAWQRALAVAAAATPWSHECDVVAIGMPAELAQLPNVIVPTDPAAWAKACVAEMTKLNERLADSPYRQRVGLGEIFHPPIVLVGPGHDDIARELADVVALVNTPLAVLAVAELPGAERIHFTDDGCVLEPYGIAFEPLAAEPSEPARVTELLENAGSDPQPVAEQEAGLAAPAAEDAETVEEILQRVMAPRPIEVEILTRQPRVHGLEKEIPTKQLSVLCYLAYHRDVSSQRLRDTFWPTATNRSTADNALSQLRTALGTGNDGEQRLTAARNTGNYQLSDEVGCDWSRASTLLAVAAARAGEEAMELLSAALDYVKGSPGAEMTPGSFDWLVEDVGTYRRIESALVDAACRLGEVALAAGDVDRAELAARQGLLLVPGQEALYRVLIRAAAIRRDFGEVDRLYRELRAVLTEHSLWESPDEETEAVIAAVRLQRAS